MAAEVEQPPPASDPAGRTRAVLVRLWIEPSNASICARTVFLGSSPAGAAVWDARDDPIEAAVGGNTEG